MVYIILFISFIHRGKMYSKYNIVAGSVSLDENEEEQIIKIESVTLHPNFQGHENDIAVIKVREFLFL